MDFSGQIGRVIENPAEAQSAALEEGHAWRVAIFSSFLFLQSVSVCWEPKHRVCYDVSAVLVTV